MAARAGRASGNANRKSAKPLMTAETHPMAFLNMARQYEQAASILLDAAERLPKEGHQVPLSHPIYFLYSHTVELALKAFLRFHGEEVPTLGRDGHAIVALLGRCQVLGLRLPGDPLGLQNVVNLLASENDVHGFRYYNPTSRSAIPELPWTRDVVNSLIVVVSELEDNAPPGRAIKIQLIVGKPTEQPRG